jgi:hypothetical protein
MGISVKWKFINAGVAGTSHRSTNLPCQDSCFVGAVKVGGEDVLIAVASDGAGSAPKADVSSDFVCTELFGRVERWLQEQTSVHMPPNETLVEWLFATRCGLEMKAAEEKQQLRDYACTLLFALVGGSFASYLQVGDGAIVTADGDNYSPIFWPQSGEYANMTYFLTDDDLGKHLQVKSVPFPVTEVGIFTDGLQRLALRYDTLTAHTPFFRPMFQRLRKEPPGMAISLCEALSVFLDSPAINERTDDDKTLILATCRPD